MVVRFCMTGFIMDKFKMVRFLMVGFRMVRVMVRPRTINDDMIHNMR